MKVIIVGCNRAEIITIKAINQNKHFLESRGQLYKVAPDALTRMRIIKDGEEEDSEEVVVYRENSIRPYHPRGVPHDQERILAEIDEHKLMGPDPSPLGRVRPWISEARGAYNTLLPMLPMALSVVILAWALLKGGS